MKITTVVPRELTDIEQATIAHFNHYFNNEQHFACLADGVVLLLETDCKGDVEQIRETARMARLVHPDFNAYVMDDGHGLVSMVGNLFAVSSQKVTSQEMETGELELTTALDLRQMCIDVTEDPTVVALVSKS